MITRKETELRKAIEKELMDKVDLYMAMSNTDIKSLLERKLLDLVKICEPFIYLGKSFTFSDNKDLLYDTDTFFKSLLEDIEDIIQSRSMDTFNLAYKDSLDDFSEEIFAAFWALKIKGSTIIERLTEYINQLKYEIEAYIAAGIAGDMTREAIIQVYLLWAKKPYKSPLLTKAFNDPAYKASRIKSKGVTFGVGRSISAFTNLSMTEKDAIVRAFYFARSKVWNADINMIGWYSVRGGSNPCSICDSEVGIFHPKTEQFWGYHTYCCCMMLPVYNFDIK